MTNLFQRGDVVVFRMYGVHVTTGTDLTNVTVKSAFVKVPASGVPDVYSTHPTKPAVSYWTAAWPVAKSYPLGVVNYSVTVVTNPFPAGLTARSRLRSASTPSRARPQVASMLTIEPSREAHKTSRIL